MQHKAIQIIGARENNLKNVSVEVPKHKVTVFTGVSGSGKSSLVFDTIAAESQRQLNETFTAFVRNRLPKYGQPDADVIANLSTAVIIDQKRIGGNARSTVGTITDIYALLRLLYSRVGKPWIGFSNAFSFNEPAGMCPDCEGLGQRVQVDLDKLLDKSKSLNEGAIRHPAFNVGGWFWKLYAHSGLFDNDKKLRDYTESEVQAFLWGADGSVTLDWKGGQINSKFEGLMQKFDRLYVRKEPDEMSEKNRKALERVVTRGPCSTCKGQRLSQRALGCLIDGRNIAELASLEVADLIEAIKKVDSPQVATLTASLRERLEHLIELGLGYLSLNRETSTLSGGESQRIKMVRHLNSSLVDMVYIFDEPTIGLHPSDVRRLSGLLTELAEKGNTVLVVEHDRDIIDMAEHVIDLGPGAGREGGEIVYQGDVRGLAKADTLTGRFMRRALPVKEEFREPHGFLEVTGASLHNLRDVTVRIPLGVLTVVTGPAGSGKSTLIHDVLLQQHPSAVVIDQSAVTTNRRSNPATYTGIMDEIRRVFARENQVSPSLFSFNSEGACPNCQGHGIIYTDLAFMDPMITTCEVCAGMRFTENVLGLTLRGRNIHDVLSMSTAEAAEFFTEPKIAKTLRSIGQVGLGYLQLGQPLNTLSGGECQRIKLATELGKKGSVFVMDEPTTGLHMSDVESLVHLVDGLVEKGNSVIVIEHNLDVVKHADWVVDLGPGGGSEGGRVIFEGTPADLAKAKRSVTGQFLAASLPR
ncbi:ATP-binding cassette domain-containing protein [Streptomyces sp. NPDC012389]|uniref:ATP-binding cassette domain-containing protein n=1 Tax=unclassified Streptomyces TaxID=2593676 RepID=UPI00081F0DD6|nr:MULTISPECIES: excinuclease ABC subunit UvrA [unclassified Streptomyces]MYR96277.1 ATP-binding cassette domain-containing protein [Streptomyces sp. SID4937]SCE06726.1 excinuclease ABC, A subunit [Streptomyces sp. ScaeMP-e83]